MNLLITGALGHIGSRFIHSIKPGEFDKVVLMDNLSTQRFPSLFNLPEDVPFTFVEDDIRTADLNEYFTGIDVVLHLAAITDAAGSFDIQDQVELALMRDEHHKVARAYVLYREQRASQRYHTNKLKEQVGGKVSSMMVSKRDGSKEPFKCKGTVKGSKRNANPT